MRTPGFTILEQLNERNRPLGKRLAIWSRKRGFTIPVNPVLSVNEKVWPRNERFYPRICKDALDLNVTLKCRRLILFQHY